jgi:apolipoprotein D and lipocalin family protein
MPPASPTPPRRLPRRAALTAAAAALAALAGCSTAPPRPPLTLAPSVDVEKMMGDWYVIGCIPTFLERGAHDAVETYRRQADGRIDTTFTYRVGGHDQPLKTLKSIAKVLPGQGNAVWTVQFIWPIEADYRVMRVDPDYRTVVIGREKRDYVWIMARTPTIPDAQYQALVDFVGREGYDLKAMVKVPHRPAAR